MSFLGGIPSNDIGLATTAKVDAIEVEAFGIKLVDYTFTATVKTTNFTIPTDTFNPSEDILEMRYLGVNIEVGEFTLSTNTVTLGFELQVGEKVVCKIFKKVK